MAVLVVGSSRPRVGRSLFAAAIAYRYAAAGNAITLVRLGGDAGATADAQAFVSIDYVSSPGSALSLAEVKTISGNVIVEAPAGDAAEICHELGARALLIETPDSSAGTRAPDQAGIIVTRVPASGSEAVAKRAGVLTVVMEDRILAAPSVADIAETLSARWLAGEDDSVHSIERVMIGTVASDAAEPYFGERHGTCIVTRFDKTDIQLAALQTDIECLIMTGGGEPSPYLIDRVRGMREEVAVLLSPSNTVETVRAMENLYAVSRFAGEPVKRARAAALLEEANVPLELWSGG